MSARRKRTKYVDNNVSQSTPRSNKEKAIIIGQEKSIEKFTPMKECAKLKHHNTDQGNLKNKTIVEKMTHNCQEL